VNRLNNVSVSKKHAAAPAFKRTKRQTGGTDDPTMDHRSRSGPLRESWWGFIAEPFRSRALPAEQHLLLSFVLGIR